MIIRYPPASALRSSGLHTICRSCFRELNRSPGRTASRQFSRASSLHSTIAGTTPRSRPEYFSANALLDRARASPRRGAITSAVAETGSIGVENEAVRAPTPATPQPAPTPDLPHRRRQKERQAAAASGLEYENASSKLSTDASAAPSNSIRRLFSILLSLSKPRLTVLVVLTSMASYAIYPVPELLFTATTTAPSLSPLTLLFLTTGTTLCSASANTLNMMYEPKYDALMSRTRNRPLVRGLISLRGAALFAFLSGLGGVTALYYGVNPTTAFLGGLNIALYAGIYTPLKRVSVINTWVGALVGGIPPLMGWVAAAGQSATGDGSWKELLLGEHNYGGWLMASLLLAWQFPHFMSLSWSIREEYKNAGYRMLCWVDPRRNGRVALRYSLLFFPICIGLCYTGVTEWSFAVTSMPINTWLVREAWRFWKQEGHKGTARSLFWASVWHLPIVLMLAMVEKKGLWRRVWRAAIGEPDLDEDDEDWIDDDEGPITSSGAAITLSSR